MKSPGSLGWWMAIFAALFCAGLVPLDQSRAAETLRVGKASNTAFPFTVIEIGLAEGIFQRHGIQIESQVFGGDAKLQQAFVAGAVDIGLGSGPGLAFVVKGSPVLAVAALANAPNIMVLIVPEDGPIKTVADLKGRTIAVSTVGSLTEWLISELSRQQGWGPDGIHALAIGDEAAQLAAMKTGHVDGTTAGLPAGLSLEQQKVAHILVRFGAIVKEFHIQVIFATLDILKKNPGAVRAFLKAWFETVAFMRSHKAETVRLATPVVGVDPHIVGEIYDVVMPDLSTDGKFNPAALALISQSFVELKQLPAAPDMQKLVTEEYLPGQR